MSRLIALDKIRVDGGTQIRAAISEQVVSEYAERMGEGVTFPPVVLFHDGNEYYLADGFHRVLATKRVGFMQIEADIHGGTQSDALWFALGANKTNGLRLTEPDKRSAAVIALRTWPEKSSRMIAEQIGVSAALVSTVKSGLSSPDDVPTRVTTSKGHSYPASPSAAIKSREQAKDMLTKGASIQDVQRVTNIGRDTLNELRRSLGLSMDKTKSGIAKRREQMRAMAERGHSSRQIASELGISEDNCRSTLRKMGVDVPADKATRGTHRHDSNRIVDRIVMDAENLTEGVTLIDFTGLDRTRVVEWIDALVKAKRALETFIKRLTKEKARNGEAA